MRSPALLLLVPAAAAVAVRPEPAAPVVVPVGQRFAVRCASGHVELEGGATAFGGKGQRGRAFGQLTRGDATASCSDEGGRASTRLQPLVLRSVATRVVKDATSARVVVTLEGQALGPYGGPDDGIYLAWSRGVVRVETACPEQHAERNRVVACVTAAQLAGRGPARLRLQSAGRLDELGGAPIDLGKLLL